MSAAVQVSLEEYLKTDYEPDCEYIDGVLEERNVGKRRHSKMQGLLYAWLLLKAPLHGQDVRIEQRVQMSPTRFRIPDICLVSEEDTDEVTQHPPALWVEILSPEDRWGRVQAKLEDILSFGVQTVWIIDPYESEAWIASPGVGAVRAEDQVLRCSKLGLEVRLNDIVPDK